jgi:hypothetical protein
VSERQRAFIRSVAHELRITTADLNRLISRLIPGAESLEDVSDEELRIIMDELKGKLQVREAQP